MLTVINKNFCANTTLCANATLKKLLMLIGLLLVLLSVFEQISDDYNYQGSGSAKVSIVQIDKDHQRDVEKAVLAFNVLDTGALLVSFSFILYNLLYQEPFLLVHHRPPNV